MDQIDDYITDPKFAAIISNLDAEKCIRRTVYTLLPENTMADAKEMMRKRKISGIPIVNKNRELKGIISIEDIIISLEEGNLDDPIEKHMTTHLVTLNNNDSMSTILKKFLTYSYGRFPVVDDDNKVVGVVTKGDLALSILQQFGNIYLHYKKRDETLTFDKDMHTLENLDQDQCFTFAIENEHIDSAGEGSARMKKFLQSKGFQRDIIQKASISAYEAEVNVVIHGGGKGVIKLFTTPEIIFLFVEDSGPGIKDIDLAMKEGWSTASDEVREHGFGAGMGLPNMRRYADKLVILSDENGTKVEMLFIIDPHKKLPEGGEEPEGTG